MITQFDILRLAIQYLQKGDSSRTAQSRSYRQGHSVVAPSASIAIGGSFQHHFLVTIICISSAPKWWVLSLAQMAAMLVPIPKQYMNRSLLKSLLCLPPLIVSTIGNLFRLKGANKKFIHTKHGE